MKSVLQYLEIGAQKTMTLDYEATSPIQRKDIYKREIAEN